MNKILFIITLPPPVHGASMMGQYIRSSSIINSQFDCDYINSSTSKNISEVGRNFGKKLFSFFKLYWKIFRALQKIKYDVCYLNINASGPAYFKEIVIVFILKIFKCKILYHCHNKGISLHSDKWIYNRLYSYQFKNTRAILLSSRLQYDIERYLPGDKIMFCPNGIPDLNEGSVRVTKLRRKIRILFLSNMMVEKGVFILLEACKLLKERRYAFECHFVGGWSNISEKSFNLKIDELDLQHHIVAHGGCYGTDRKKHFLEADIFVFPTYCDSLPLVLIEAMQYFLPIVTTDEGAIPDMVEDQCNGFITPRLDHKSLADKIGILIESPSMRFSMGTVSRDRYKRYFTLEAFERKFASVLHKVVSDERN